MENPFFTQPGMENALSAFIEYLRTDRPGSVNAEMQPEFVSCDYETKTLTLRFMMQDWMTNPAGVAHGGVIATAFDMTMGSLAYWAVGGLITPTMSFNHTYIRPIPLLEYLVLEAQVSNAGKTAVAVTCRGYMEGRPEKLVGTANGVYFAKGSPMTTAADRGEA